MKTATFFVLLTLATAFASQEKAADRPSALTDRETIELRNKQVTMLNLRDQKRQTDEQMEQQKKQTDDELDKKIQEAQNELVGAANEVFKSRGITQNDAGICDGPTPSRKECDGVKAGELALRPLPKPEAKK